MMRAATHDVLTGLTQAMAFLLPGRLCQPLRRARRELQRNLHLAFRLASAHQRPVVLEPGFSCDKGCLSLHLPEGVRWGRPATVPLPPSLADSGWRGGKPRPITVMPQRRATANVWFLHHGREALCLRLGLSGTVEILRYRPVLRTWTHC
jgi:hypothetical protein